MSTLDAFFEESARAWPDRPALVSDGRVYTYGDVSEAADAVSGALQRAGVANARVGLLCSKSLMAYAGMLGILSSGNAYVPLNSKFPIERLARVCRDAELEAMIVDEESAALAPHLLRSSERGLVVLAADTAECLPDLAPSQHRVLRWSDVMRRGRSSAAPTKRSHSGGDAYLLFTSGSTGKPKGVAVTHDNACHCIEAMGRLYPTGANDKFTQFVDLTFDISVGEIFMCWRSGGCLYPAALSSVISALTLVLENGITVWSSVPTVASNLKALGLPKPGSLKSVRWSFFCGEALPAAVADAWQAATPDGKVVNLYGPTEAAVFATSYIYERGCDRGRGVVPIGRAFPSFEYRIASVSSQDVVGEPGIGELLLSGPQVVAGYWRDEAATRKAFIQLDEEGLARTWYRTGDLVSYDDHVGLVFHGRCDHQVKIRGYRVELQEVASVIRLITGSDLAAVVPVRRPDGRVEDLVAYCSAVEDEASVRTRCAQHLPSYMVPRRVIAMANFPLNDNGKVDQRALERLALEICK